MITAVVAVAAGAGTYVLTQQQGHGGSSAAHTSGSAGPVSPAAPLRVLAVSPAGGARRVDGSGPVVVTFSAPLAAGSPTPALRPPVQGSWQSAGDVLVFTPSVPLRPSSRFTVTIPAGPRGVRSVAGGLLARPVSGEFHTGTLAPLRLSEMLSQLGYLPVSWAPSTPGVHVRSLGGAPRSGWADELAQAYSPPAGTFTWDSGYPATLTSLWSPGQFNVILKGAVMAFESEHGMKMDGGPSRRLWTAVMRSAARGDRNRNGYTYAIASKASPETLTIWHDGREVMRSLTNTGIPVSPTVDGTFPVYLRLRYQIMSGTNPDGSHYADPVSFVSYFNGGDAVHYFPRGSYGFQQSLGCVELPYGDAEQAFPYLTYGSLVTVTG